MSTLLKLWPSSVLTPIFSTIVRVFANGPGDLGSIPGRVIPKTQKMVLDASLLNTQHYKVRIKGKVEQSREGVAPSPTPWCSSYRKGNLRVTLDNGHQLYLLIYKNSIHHMFIYIYIYISIWVILFELFYLLYKHCTICLNVSTCHFIAMYKIIQIE